MMRSRKVFMALPMILLTAAILACARPDDPPYAGVERDAVGTGTVFIWAVANGDEHLAMSTLSTTTQLAVAADCENGQVLACFDQTDVQDWDTIELGDIGYLPKYSDGSTFVYHVILSRRRIRGLSITTIGVVLEIVEEDGEWKIDSWRGWIPLDGGFPERLIDGSNPVNAFPLEE